MVRIFVLYWFLYHCFDKEHTLCDIRLGTEMILLNTQNKGRDQIVNVRGLFRAFVIHITHNCKVYVKFSAVRSHLFFCSILQCFVSFLVCTHLAKEERVC